MKLDFLIVSGLFSLSLCGTPIWAFEPIVVIGGEAQVIHPGGGNQEVLATSEQTDGMFGLVTTAGVDAPDMGPGMIVQNSYAEMWYVLEGTYQFTVGGQTYEGGPGTFVAVDRGQVHQFVAQTPGKLLMLYLPGGFEQFFIDWEAQGLDFGPELGALEASYGVVRP